MSKSQQFFVQQESDVESLTQMIFEVVATFLPPPSDLERDLISGPRNVVNGAAGIHNEMRTQWPKYIMLPPLQPEYDTNGDLVRKIKFSAALMNERSGATPSNEELERQGAIVSVLLFPLVVKKDDDTGAGDEEVVVYPAQVLVDRQY